MESQTNRQGCPFYGQIQSFNLTNILVIAVRHFGGVKLGVGGLINASKLAAQFILEPAIIVEKTINQIYGLNFKYKNLNIVMRIVKELHIKILKQYFNEQCYLEFEIRKSHISKIEAAFNSHFELETIHLND